MPCAPFPRARSRWVLGTTTVLPFVVPAGWALAARVQPGSYSSVRETVSQLAGLAATDRWIVTSALYGVGLLYLLAAYGMSALYLSTRVGLALAGVAALGVAYFPEPARGESSVHAAFAALGAVALTTWPALTARQRSVLQSIGRWPSLAAIIVSFTLLAFVIFETRQGTALGLAERLTGLQTCWPTVVAIALHRHRTSARERHVPCTGSTAVVTLETDAEPAALRSPFSGRSNYRSPTRCPPSSPKS